MKTLRIDAMFTAVVLVLCFACASTVRGAIDHFGIDGGGNTLQYYNWSPLNVIETITDIGAGSYRYEYSFVNTDASPIYDFGVTTTFEADAENGFDQHAGWQMPQWMRADGVHAVYDARNLDPDIIGFLGIVNDPPMDPATAIQTGEFASGLSMTASVFDPSPKYYFYETIASGYAQNNGTGKVAAVGMTPEPATLLLLGLGAAGLLGRRRT